MINEYKDPPPRALSTTVGQDGCAGGGEMRAPRRVLGVSDAHPRLRSAVRAQLRRAMLRLPGGKRHRMHCAHVRAVRGVRGHASTAKRNCKGTLQRARTHA